MKTADSRKKERILLGFLILLLLGAVIVLAIILAFKLTLTDCGSGVTTAERLSGPPLDVAVIGAGLAGSYVAWKLRDRDMRIGVFEHYNRIGGRFYTRTMNGAANIELGAGYFYPYSQLLMNQTTHEVGLTLAHGAEKVSSVGPGKQLFVRGKHLESDKLYLNNIPYNIDFHDMDVPLAALISTKVQLAVDISMTKPMLEWKMKQDKSAAYKHSWRHLLRRITKSEEYNAIVDLTFPFRSVFNHDITLPLVAAAIMSSQGAGQAQHYTIKEGMQELPKKLIQLFLKQNNKHRLHLNHRLDSMEKAEDGYILRFIKTQTNGFETTDTKEISIIKAKKVVLAVPRRALDLLHWDPLKFNPELKHNTRSTHDNKAFKLFLKYKSKWWKEGKFKNVSTMITDLPLVQSTEFEKDNILLAAYCDDTCVSYWEPLTQGESCNVCTPGEYNVTDKMVKEVSHQLAQVYKVNVKDIPEPEAAMAHSWSADPIGCALSLYRPDYNWTEVMQYMAKPIQEENVHIVGSAFSTSLNTIWAEGALESAKYMLDNYFPTDKVKDTAK